LVFEAEFSYARAPSRMTAARRCLSAASPRAWLGTQSHVLLNGQTASREKRGWAAPPRRRRRDSRAGGGRCAVEPALAAAAPAVRGRARGPIRPSLQLRSQQRRQRQLLPLRPGPPRRRGRQRQRQRWL